MKRGTFRKQSYAEIALKQRQKNERRKKVLRASKTTLKSTTARQKGTKKPKRPTLTKLKKKLWELCRQITFKKYGNVCYTTGSIGLVGSNLQCGHGKPKGALQLKYQYDLRNLRPQSYHANINLGGMSDIFIAKMEREKDGLEFLQEACVKIDGVWHIKRIPTMGSIEAYQFVLNKIEEYKEILERL